MCQHVRRTYQGVIDYHVRDDTGADAQHRFQCEETATGNGAGVRDKSVHSLRSKTGENMGADIERLQVPLAEQWTAYGALFDPFDCVGNNN